MLSPRIGRLEPSAAHELEASLAENPSGNLFQLDLLRRLGPGVDFYLARDEARQIIASVLVIAEGRLVVPEGDPEAALALGHHLSRRFDVRRVIGESDASEALWRACGGGEPRLWRTHRLLELTASTVGSSGSSAIQVAVEEDMKEMVELSAAMHFEELRVNPLERDRKGFERSVAARIHRGRSYIVRQGERIVFKVDVGADCDYGAQLEGVYTIPEARAQGLASSAIADLCDLLLDQRPRVTLHVHDENRAALRAYEKVGFAQATTFRLISMD